MEPVRRKVLEKVLAGMVEPVIVVRVDQPDWPVALANPAFEGIGGEAGGKAFADVIEALGGRELALEVSEAVRSGQETSFPMEVGSREYLLVLKPVSLDDDVSHYAAYWRSNSGSASVNGAEMHHALLNAKRRIRDLSRDDPVTGLLNGRAFREVFEHDWAGFMPAACRPGDPALPAPCQRRRCPSRWCAIRRAFSRLRGGERTRVCRGNRDRRA